MAPWAAVPLPGGRLVPWGSTVMFQLLMSASEIGLPRPGESAARPEDAVASVSKRAAASASRRALRVDMFDLPLAVDAPAGEAVVVVVGEAEHVRHRFGLPALGDEIRPQRLRIAGLVPGAALQDDRLAVPPPGHAEAGIGLGIDRPLQGSFAPALAAVGRAHDLADAAGARIGDAGVSGVLRSGAAASAPSARNHFAWGSTPAWSSSVDSGTPVHSAQEERPCKACTVAWSGSLENIGALLPPHSTKCVRDTIG